MTGLPRLPALGTRAIWAGDSFRPIADIGRGMSPRFVTGRQVGCVCSAFPRCIDLDRIGDSHGHHRTCFRSCRNAVAVDASVPSAPRMLVSCESGRPRAGSGQFLWQALCSFSPLEQPFHALSLLGRGAAQPRHAPTRRMAASVRPTTALVTAGMSAFGR